MKEFSLNKEISSNQKLFNFYLSFKKYFNLIGFEAFVWVIALVYFAFIVPNTGYHFTICPLANMGLDFCPGCGLGHSITQFFHGNFVQSFHTHPLGVFALIIIFHRIYTLLKTNIINNKKATA